MVKKGTTKKPFWVKARREYTCFNCGEKIAEGEDVLMFQPLVIGGERTGWSFACGECGEWEMPLAAT